jgi:TolB protein
MMVNRTAYRRAACIVLTTALTLFGTTESAHAGEVAPSGKAQPEGSCTKAGCFHLESTIAFTTTRDSNPPATTPAAANAAAEIYLMNPDPADPNPRRIGSNLLRVGFANLSPDGKHIVFDQASTGECGGQTWNNISNLYVMDTDGSNQRLLTRGSSATWSPDGKDIAFHASASYYETGGQSSGCPIKPDPGAATTDSDIFVANVANLLAGVGHPSNITKTPDLIEDDADWSLPTPGAPDGRIAFTSHSAADPLTTTMNNDAEMYVMKPNGSSRRQLTFNNEEERAVSWSPDGSRIVYSCRIGGGMNVFQICVMNADGTNIQQLTTDAVQNLSATWSPDGQQIVFNKLLPRVPGTMLTNYQLFTMNLNVSPPVAKEITCTPDQNTPGYLYPCPQGVTPTDGINLLAHWGVLHVPG